MLGPVRVLADHDVPHAVALAVQRGWGSGHIESFSWLTAIGIGYGIDHPSGNGLAGCVFVTPHDGWFAIGKMIVAESCERQGVGGQLIAHALAHHQGHAVLDATQAGQPLYARHGFLPVGARHTVVGPWPLMLDRPMRVASGDRGTSVRSVDWADDLTAVLDLDELAYGYRRQRLVAGLPQLAQMGVIAHDADGMARGYACAHMSADWCTIGPLVAPNEGLAEALMVGLLHRLPTDRQSRRRLRMDVSADAPRWLDRLAQYRLDLGWACTIMCRPAASADPAPALAAAVPHGVYSIALQATG